MLAVPLMFTELGKGDRVYGLVCLSSCEVATTRNGKHYFRMEFRDESSSLINGIMWEADPESILTCPVVVLVDGEFGEFNGAPQIRINSMSPTDDDVAGYLPSTYRPAPDLVDEFYGIIDMIRDDEIRRLVHACFDAAPGFWAAPSAIRFHGAYRGGLLEHTLHVTRLCLTAADLYGERVNRDVLIAAAAMHDIGKSDAYDSPESRQPTETERMVGHIIRGTMLVERVAQEIGYRGDVPLTDILHPIISHHGELEFGAPVKPGTAEALILSGADSLDADVTGYFDLWRDTPGNDAWTYSRQANGWMRRPAEPFAS